MGVIGPSRPGGIQLANKLLFLSQLLRWDLTGADQFSISSVADSRQRLEHQTTNLEVLSSGPPKRSPSASDGRRYSSTRPVQINVPINA